MAVQANKAAYGGWKKEPRFGRGGGKNAASCSWLRGSDESEA